MVLKIAMKTALVFKKVKILQQRMRSARSMHFMTSATVFSHCIFCHATVRLSTVSFVSFLSLDAKFSYFLVVLFRHY